mmetsp:Transcript_18911/g.56698  ORF Transcript_18911/g.56698 Transcript_18911/m.56698 type:complete len:242 (-) Transcript_18911:1646-2371(-)
MEKTHAKSITTGDDTLSNVCRLLSGQILTHRSVAFVGAQRSETAAQSAGDVGGRVEEAKGGVSQHTGGTLDEAAAELCRRADRSHGRLVEEISHTGAQRVHQRGGRAQHRDRSEQGGDLALSGVAVVQEDAVGDLGLRAEQALHLQAAQPEGGLLDLGHQRDGAHRRGDVFAGRSRVRRRGGRREPAADRRLRAAAVGALEADVRTDRMDLEEVHVDAALQCVRAHVLVQEGNARGGSGRL